MHQSKGSTSRKAAAAHEIDGAYRLLTCYSLHHKRCCGAWVWRVRRQRHTTYAALAAHIWARLPSESCTRALQQSQKRQQRCKTPKSHLLLAVRASAFRSLSINLEFSLTFEPRLMHQTCLIVRHLTTSLCSKPDLACKALGVQAVPRSRFERSLLLRVAPGCPLCGRRTCVGGCCAVLAWSCQDFLLWLANSGRPERASTGPPGGLGAMMKPTARRRQAQCAAVEDVMGAPASGQSLVQRNLLPNLLEGQLLDLHRQAPGALLGSGNAVKVPALPG